MRTVSGEHDPWILYVAKVCRTGCTFGRLAGDMVVVLDKGDHGGRSYTPEIKTRIVENLEERNDRNYP